MNCKILKFQVLLSLILLSVKSYGQVSLVKDINQTVGSESSDPSDFTEVNNNLFFVAQDKWSTTRKLWVSDGTQAGTFPLLNTLLPSSLKSLNDTLYFIGYDAVHGYELWRSDGTEAGTFMVKDIMPGSSNSNIHFVGELNGELYFSASENSSNLHYLWKTNGTLAGTVVVHAQWCNYSSGSTVLNGLLYYSSMISGNNYLYVTDGIQSGTIVSTDVRTPTEITKFGNKIIFAGQKSGFGNELWISDGTSAGTVLLKDIRTGSNDSNPSGFTVHANEVYFLANDGINGFEIWKSDGTLAGTVLAIDLIPGSSSTNYMSKMLDYNGDLVFLAKNTSNITNLYKSDGTTAGTQSIMSFTSTSASLPTINNGLLYFVFTNTATTSGQLWRTDGTTAGTFMLKIFNSPQTFGGIHYVGSYSNKLVLGANDGIIGRELWESDGTVSGTGLFKDLKGSSHSRPRLLTQVGNELFFVADSGNVNNYLFKSNGTPGGTMMIKNIDGIGNESQYQMFAYNGKALFGKTGIPGNDDLCVSDGTFAGTQSIMNIDPSAYAYPKGYVEMNGFAYFTANIGTTYRIYRTDGTSAGSTQVYPNHIGGSKGLNKYNNVLYFDGIDGELWRTDGTSSGTFRLKDINTNGSQSSNPKSFREYNNELYFIVNDGVNLGQLWKTDGTASGTVLTTASARLVPCNVVLNNDLLIMTNPSGNLYILNKYNSVTNAITPIHSWTAVTINNFVNLDSLVIFVVDGVIWKTDGFSAQIVKNTKPFSYSNGPNSFSNGETFVRIDNFLYFAQVDSTGSEQIWRTDGTTCGTNRISQFSGSYDSYISDLESMGGNLYFSAFTPELSHELWKFNVVPPIVTTINDTICPNTSLNWNNIIIQNTGTYCQSFMSSIGIDSIVYLNLVIDTIINTVDYRIECDSLTWIDGNTYYSSTNTPTFVLQNAAGCDSIITLDLIITNSNSGTDVQTACDSLTWIDGITYYSSTNIPIFTLQNAAGCDSVVTLNLTITHSTTGTDILSNCDSLTWIDGITYYSSTNTPTFTLQNAIGCDSTLTLHLTITNSTSGTDVQTACDSYDWIDGNTYTISTNTPTFVLQNAAGCDSTVTLNLTIIQGLPLTVENVFVFPSDANSCLGEAAIDLSGNPDFELDFDNGSQIIISSGYSLVTGLCAGIHDLHVTDDCGDTLTTQIVIPVDSNYVFNNPLIDSLAQDSLGVTLTNCDIYYAGIDTAYIDSIWATGNTVNVIWNIVDSNGSNLDTTSYILNNGNGVYWLQLSVFCPFKSVGEYFTATEAIYFNNGHVSTAGLTDFENKLFEIYPNPTNDQVHINFSGSNAELTVYDAQGKMVLKDQIQNQEIISLQNFERGVYLFDFKNSNGHSVQRVVKQ